MALYNFVLNFFKEKSKFRREKNPSIYNLGRLCDSNSHRGPWLPETETRIIEKQDFPAS